ncbi:MAG: SMP-30/gluconolactonase/LRE family protein [Steroidobacteraceae bacterium]|jgi:gluconolactonase
MFAAPPIIETEIFTSLPEELRIRNRTTELSKFLRGNFDSYLDGTSFDRFGNLYCVDVVFGRIFRVDPQGTFHVVAEYDGEPSGLAIHRDGRLFVADRRHGIIVINPPDNRIQHILERFDREAFRGPCDLVFSADGDLYFTDQGNSDLIHRTGRIFRLCADGRLDLLIDDLPGPCGIGLDLAGRVLYASLTRANSIIKVPLLPDGRPSRVLNFIQLSGGGGPDGIAVDNEGGIAVAHPVIAAVWLFDWRGQPILRVNLCRGRHGTNVAYGGADGRRLYITEAETGTIQFANVPVSGVPKFSHLSKP